MRALVAYDGTDYFGYQRQRSEPSIQAEIEDALSSVTRQKTTVYAAGRTDAGVHASGQVIAFDTIWRHPPEALLKAANVELPDAVVFRHLEEASMDFQPRFDARERTYQYRMFFDTVRHPLKERFAWRLAHKVDVLPVAQAIEASLIAERDFGAFGQPPRGSNTVRHVIRASWVEAAEGVYLFEITANAFLNRMVRRIVGTLCQVGQGRMSPRQFEEMIERGRRMDTSLAPPHGLTLTSVTY